MTKAHLLGAALAAALLSVSGPVRAQDAAPPGDAANGKKIYLAVGCFECHGRVGQGGAFNGPAPTLAKTRLPFEGFKMQLRNPANDMPAYSEVVMPEKALADIYAYLQSLTGPRKDITILND
jgi:mono/diheme cytochrome c family protein